jgi:hypothetical protein
MTLTPMIFQQDPEAGGVCPKIVGQLLAVVLQSGQLDKIGTHPAGALPFPGRGGRFRLGIGGRGSCGRWIERPSTEERGWKNPSATPGEGCIINFVRLGRIVGAASAATPASSRTRGSGLPKQVHCDPYAIEDEGSGRKPLLQKPSFCRSGFSRDPLRHREPGARGCRSSLHRDPCVIEGGGSGLFLSDDRRSGGGQRPAVALPGPQGAMGGARWPLPRSDHCRVMSRRTTARGCPAISGHLLGGGRLG